MYIGEMQIQARDMARQFAEAVVRPLAATCGLLRDLDLAVRRMRDLLALYSV